ncbi:TLN1 [Cordylochernes scorpioides]|uniref:TLN1 n=1 Tax=Cordylochernes scorpioides TaxID=51811 RepID=A0ABY6L865_9ARAC|nr:TLN1 [Cordylochernes scorpioides]
MFSGGRVQSESEILVGPNHGLNEILEDSLKMAMLSLKVSIQEHGITKTIQFDRSMKTRDACKVIRDKMQEVPLGPEKDYGLFLSDEDQKKGVWLEMDYSLEHYLLRNGDMLVYKRKMRTLKVRMLDGSVKTVRVDDAQPVRKLMQVICTKIGITNHDEYSLVRETQEENKEPSYGTLTLRRAMIIMQFDFALTNVPEPRLDKNKMEQLKKKLKTDDDMNWVDHSKTLREQGIDEEENLLLRRKYFFSDHNVDSRDPIQLNLLYVQARDAILNGAHPVTVEQALQFGGIQCQIQFGDYNESKHKPGLFDLKDFLPKDFYKNKGIAKKVFAEHKKFSGLPEIEAKVQYVTLARSLKTYGVTFFLVKEQRKNKSKLVPRLLGVTKDSVLRLDEKTKEVGYIRFPTFYGAAQILETWPLTRVRKWAASPNSFTLGEQISQLIAGYIDIIIKKQRSNDHMGIEGDEGSTMVEDNVTPAKATILQQNPGARLSQISTGSIALPAVIRVGANGAQTPGLGQVQPVRFGDVKNQAHSVYAPVSPQHSRVHSAELSEPQRAYMSLIDSGQEAVEAAQKELESKQPELESENSSIQWKQNTLDVKRQTVSSQIAAMNAATAQVITYTSVPPEEVDHPAVGAAISTIATNLPEMSKDVKMMASLMEEDSGDRLLDAARGLCVAFSELLRAAEPEEPRQGLLAAATRVGEASHALLYTIGEEPEGGQEVVMGLAKAVSNAAASLVLQAKAIATRCVEHPEPQSAVIHSATQFALATSQLVACSQVIAPTITNRVCRHQLLEAAQEVAHAMEGVVVACQESGVPDERQDVRAAADNVNSALQGLQDHVISLSAESPQEDVVEKIFTTSNRVTTAAGDTGEMMRQAHCLAKATSELITTMKGEADMVGDNDMRNRIMSAARILADATTRLLDAAKGCSNNPKDEDCQVALHRAVEDVCQATSGAASAAFKRKLIRKLENAAKETCSAATQTIAAAKGASVHLTNAPSSDELLESCMEVAAMIPKVIQGVKATMADVDSVPAQMALIKSSLAFVQVCAYAIFKEWDKGINKKEMFQPCQRMVLASRGSLASVNSPPHRLHLANACTTQEDRLAALLEALERAQGACSALEIERALAAIQEISEDLKQWKDQLEKGELKPLEGDSPENTAALMGASCRSVGSAMVQLLTAANQGQESTTGVAARDTARHLKGLAQACRAVAATGNEPAPLDCAEEAMACSKDLVSAAQAALEERPGDPSRLTAVARSVSTALSDCLSCLPALRQLDRALAAVAKSGQQLATSQQHFPTSNKPYSELQTNLNTAAASLNDSAARLVEDAPTSRLATTAEDFGRSYENLMDCGLEMAGSTVNPEVQGQVVVSLRDVSIVSSKLLSAAKLTAADPTAPFSHNQLAAAARSVTDAINQLVDVCTCAGPGQKECDNAIRKIQWQADLAPKEMAASDMRNRRHSMRPLLDNLSEPVRDASYFECLDSVLEQSKVLGEAMASIVSSHVKPEPLAHGVKTMASAICELIEAGVQARSYS